MLVKTFTLVNEEKVSRALNGVPKAAGETIGGIGAGAYYEDNVWKRDGKELSEGEISALETALIAEYDKLGGLIRRGKDNVKMGSFYDFKGHGPRSNPQVVFTYRVNGRYVEVADGTELPGEVKATKVIEEQAEKEVSEPDEVEKPVKRRKSKE